ncbi:hypothetical protein [Streptomyces sp. NPDC057580]|uniref:hypothetical protein n=1 Tax=Streptomyces sp. NPDC057580 TaxID=3346173 RepID=UPI0036A8C602
MQLQQLVVVPTGKRLSELDRLCRSPRDISARGVGKALERYESLRAFGGHAWNLDAIPPGRLQALVRFAKAARSQAVSDLRGDRRPATLVAFAAVMPELVADEAIEVFDLVMGDIIRSSATTMTKQRLRTLKDLDAAGDRAAHSMARHLHHHRPRGRSPRDARRDGRRPSPRGGQHRQAARTAARRRRRADARRPTSLSLRRSKWPRKSSHSASVGVRYSSAGRRARRRVMKARWASMVSAG